MQSRRRFIAHAACVCALGVTKAHARETSSPLDLTPLIVEDYAPQADDERGLWEQCDRLEREIEVSNMLIRDASLTKYLQDVTHNLIGQFASSLRIYPVRNPDFNAAMAPNGMMIVNSGLLARVRNEAQLAAVVGHECGHYLRLHAIKSWRDYRTKSAVAAFVAIAGAGATGVTGSSWYDLAHAIGNGLLLSIFSFSRAQESEADSYGIKLLQESGYAPHAASDVWAQLIDERKSSAAARNKKYKDRSYSALSTHPPTSERMYSLKASALALEAKDPAATHREERRSEYIAHIAPIRQMLLDEQVKLNDPGASLYLIHSLAKDGWDGVLRYNEGEVYRLRDEEDDAQRASAAYELAVQYSDAPPEAYRAHGYALIKAGKNTEGRAALVRYLELSPQAVDAAMVRFTLQQ